ncbi:CBS domain-containing protein [Streptomyces sp. 8N706]|uniref:CBS domain-containing protein n=1 Tax=Streptomyces sp. 8N706 TaxID=3457416 RepID=UPI003FD39D31
MATTETMRARDVMHAGTQCVGENETLLDAARMMRDLDVGCVPICGEDDRLKGMITDRDIVVGCCAEGKDPARVKAGEFAGELFWIDADAPITEALQLMETHQIKRLPVIDVRNDHRLVGMISEANLARNIPDEMLAEFVERVYAY